MTDDDDLVKRLRDRAKHERLIQANNEAVAAALMGQRLLFDQGHRSPSNTYAVRLSLDHEKCAKQDAELAADWDEAADHIEALTKQLEAARLDAKEAKARIEELQSRLRWVIEERDDTFARMLRRAEEAEAKLAKAVDETLDAASAYMKKQYGIEALSHPVDRARIIAELKGDKT